MTIPMSQNPLNPKGLEAAYAAYEATGISYDAMGITAAIRAYIASQEAAAPSEEPVATGEAYWLRKNAVLVRELGSSMSPGALAAAMECRADALVASPAVAPVASVKTGWTYSINYGPEGEENWANLTTPEGEHVANIRTHHAMAIVAGMNTSPAMQTWKADWERIAFNLCAEFGSEFVADKQDFAKAVVREYFQSLRPNARILSSIIPATKGGEEIVEALKTYQGLASAVMTALMGNETRDDLLLADKVHQAHGKARVALAALSQDKETK